MKDLYVPLTLAKLPRQRCPHEILYMAQGEGRFYVEAEKCKGKPENGTGWCPGHRYVFEMLQSAAAADYPEIIIGALTIPSGVANWEGYGQRHIPARHDVMMKMLKQIAARIKREMDQARQQAIARMHTDVA
jgi:hypothetical protein